MVSLVDALLMCGLCWNPPSMCSILGRFLVPNIGCSYIPGLQRGDYPLRLLLAHIWSLVDDTYSWSYISLAFVDTTTSSWPSFWMMLILGI